MQAIFPTLPPPQVHEVPHTLSLLGADLWPLPPFRTLLRVLQELQESRRTLRDASRAAHSTPPSGW